MGRDGFAAVQDVLRQESMRDLRLRVTQQELEDIVRHNDKARFELQWKGQALQVRARQGRSQWKMIRFCRG